LSPLVLPLFFRDGIELHQILRDYRAVIDAPRVCIRYQYVARFEIGIRPNFALFATPCKLGERLAKCLSQNEVQSRSFKAEFQISDVLLSFETTMRQRRFASKIGRKFALFDPLPVEIRRKMGEMTELILRGRHTLKFLV